MTRFARGTWIAPEEYAYPDGHMNRLGLAALRTADGQPVSVRAGIPDTFFSIPAYRLTRSGERGQRGTLTVDTSGEPTLVFTPYPRKEHWQR